jgi:hypothetical protein
MIEMVGRTVPLEARHFGAVIHAFLDDHGEWRSSPDVSYRFDRRHRDYVWSFRLSALSALCVYIVASGPGKSVAERQHGAADIQWRAKHAVSPPVSAPTVRMQVPDVLPGQMPLFA